MLGNFSSELGQNCDSVQVACSFLPVQYYSLAKRRVTLKFCEHGTNAGGSPRVTHCESCSLKQLTKTNIIYDKNSSFSPHNLRPSRGVCPTFLHDLGTTEYAVISLFKKTLLA